MKESDMVRLLELEMLKTCGSPGEIAVRAGVAMSARLAVRVVAPLEREACAALVEELAHSGEFDGMGIEYAPETITKAIRARGKE